MLSASSPFLSLIIAIRNAAGLLRTTLACMPQNSPFSYEVIIQDGMSSDGTAEVVNDFACFLPISYERVSDSGIYDAWNKALARVNGQWVIFSGAGDALDWSALAQCVTTLASLPDHVAFYATPVCLMTRSGASLEVLSPSSTPRRTLPQGMSVPHPGLFHRSNLFFQQQFNAACRIAGDYDFLCRTMREDNVAVGQTSFASMLVGGVSGNMDSIFFSEKELWSLSRRYFPHILPWKPGLRLLRSGGCLLVRRVTGQGMAGCVADLPRLFMGKPRLWSLAEQVPRISLPALPNIPCVDLLVATVGRISELDRLLTSLEAQTYGDFHIYLADQNAPGYLDAMLARHAALPITRITLPSQGVSVARNALLPLAKGAIIAFPDDDCWYAPETLARVVDAFRGFPQCGALLGVWTPSEQMPLPRWREGRVNRCGLFLQGGTCIQFFRREALEGTYFDPMLGPGTNLPYGCGEDTDFLLSVQAGTEVRRCPAIRVFHPSPFDALPSEDKIRAYAAGRMFLLHKHGFPFWFHVATVLFPLCVLPVDTLKRGRRGAWYRWVMFRARLRAFLAQWREARQRG